MNILEREQDEREQVNEREHPLQAIADGAMVQLASPSALLVGHIDHADDMVRVFGDTSEGKKKVELLQSLQAITPKEFKDLTKASVKRSAKLDLLSGFVVDEGATGADKYGPKERSMRSQVSQASVVWGAMKQGIPAIPSGFVAAVGAARAYLGTIGKKWDGSTVMSDEEVARREALELESLAYAAAREADPSGKLSDMGDAIEAEKARLIEEATSEAADKLVKNWNDKGTREVYLLACERFLAQD